MGIKRVIEVRDSLGLHSRPAGQIVMLARELDFAFEIGILGATKVSAVSPLALMALKAKTGALLEIELDLNSEAKADELAAQLQEILND